MYDHNTDNNSAPPAAERTDDLTAGSKRGTTAAAAWRRLFRRRSLDLTDGPVVSTLWRLATPLAVGFVINMVYAWTDMYFVSRLGDDATAALGFGDQIMFVVWGLASGFSVGTGIMIARRVGQQRTRQAAHIATQAYSFMALYSAAIVLTLYLLMPMLLSMMGLTGRVHAFALVYTSTLLFGLPGNLLTFQANASVRSTGNTVFPMVVLLFTAALNATLDPILIFGKFGLPALGISGAAISTATSQWVGAAICIYALYRGKLSLRLSRPTLRFDWKIIRGIFAIGIPASLQTLSVSVSRTIIMSIANTFGSSAAAAYTIGQKVDALVFMPIFAVGIAIETLVGQNIGALRFDRVKKFRRAAIRHLGGMAVVLGAIAYLAAPAIARIFGHQPEVIDTTVRYLHVSVFSYVLFAIGQTGTRSLSGAGHATRSMMIVAVMLFGVQVPLAYGLSHFTGLGETGVFASITVSYLVFAVISSLAVRGDGWMRKKL